VSIYDFFAVFSAIAWILMQNFTNIFSHPISIYLAFGILEVSTLQWCRLANLSC